MSDQKLSQTTNFVFKYLVQNRENVLLQVQKGVDVKDFIPNLMILMGRAQCFEYIEQMKKRKYKVYFEDLMKLKPDISQSAYVKELEDIYKSLMEKIAEEEENPDLATQLSSIFLKLAGPGKLEKSVIQQSQVRIPEENFLERSILRTDPIVQPNPQKSFIKSESRKIVNEKIPNSTINKNKPVESQKKLQQPILRVPHIEKEPHFEPDVKNFKVKDLKVVVRFFSQTFDYSYGYGNRLIKNQMGIRIRDYLEKNPVSFKRVTNSIPIMEDVSIVKSKDAGNYYFDPFCQSVEIKIERRDKKQFTNDFKIEGNFKDLQISEEKVQKITDWNKAFLKLTPKNDVTLLVDYIGQNRQQSLEGRTALIQGLKKNGGANTIQDLFNWQQHSYQKIGVKPTWMHLIQQTIEMIKDNSKSGPDKSFSQKKRQCLKVANSHKILRYLVYKNYDMKEVLKLPWLNMKNVKRSIQIVKDQIHNAQLLNQLEKYFDQFALDPKDDPIPYSRGLVLYGPPGTGKTVLTEAMPNIMGFHLISKGLSAADFMKSLVGESSRMIRDLVNRANQSPYLLCSVGIDEVDGLVPDRKDKDEKNKGEGISMLLSVIGGNKDVSNLVFMTSTNYLKKIDEAIRRRLSGQYQVGRPNPEQRKKIILSQVSYLKQKQHEQLLNHLILITTNFTGASLKGISNQLNKILRTKQMQGKKNQIVEDEVTDSAILMARQFSITLGVYTLPEIYKSQSNRRNFFTKKFLSRVTDNLLVVQQYVDSINSKNKFILMYANKVIRYVNGKKEIVVEKQEQKFFLEVQENREFEDFENYIKAITKNQMVTIRSNNCKKNNNKYRNNLKQALDYIPNKNKESTLVLVEDFAESEDENIRTANFLLDSRKNIYIIFYMTPYSTSSNFFTSLYGKSVDYQAKLNYTGRIFVELNEQARMAFELNRTIEEQSKVAFKLFLKSEQSNSPKNVIPELVNFFTKQQVSYILLLDYELLLQNDAFEEKKMLEIMEEKMTQAKNYDRVAVIINIDSLITMSQNASDSNFGRNMSYSVVNHNMYQILLNYMSQFAMVNENVNKWVSIVIKNEELVKKVKKDLNWPLYPEEQQKKKQEQEKDKEKQCGRCGIWFTDRKNKEQRACMQHPGKIVDMKTGEFEENDPDELLGSVVKNKMKNKGKDQNKQKQEAQERYKWTCCKKNITEDGHQPFYHIPANFLNTDDDDLYMNRLRNQEKWDKQRMQMT